MTDISIAYVPPDVQSILGIVDTYMRWNNSKNKHNRSYLKYHPSEFGGCLRASQYRRYVDMGYISVVDKGFDSKILRLFDKGHNMHSRWERYFSNIGIARGVWKCSNPLCRMFDDSGKQLDLKAEDVYGKPARSYGKENKIGIFKPEKCVCGCNRLYYEEISISDDEMNMYGHVDLVLDFTDLEPSFFDGTQIAFNKDCLPTDPIVVDMKTINDYRWRQQLLRKGPSFKYIVQLCIYTHILDLEYGLLIYENKNNSEVKAFKIKRNDKMFNEIKRQSKLLHEMASLKTPKLPPPRPISKDDYECSNCSFKSMCHVKGGIWDNEKKLIEQRNKFYGSYLS